MKIYTKTGDAGETALFGGGRVPKSDPRVSAYGDVDELNAWIGATRAWCADEPIRAALERIQGELFVVGAILATPNPARRKGERFNLAAERIDTQNTHGTGCTLSSAIAAGLAKDLPLAEAVREAKAYVTAAIKASDRLTIGQGHGPVHHFHHWWGEGKSQ